MERENRKGKKEYHNASFLGPQHIGTAGFMHSRGRDLNLMLLLTVHWTTVLWRL